MKRAFLAEMESRRAIIKCLWETALRQVPAPSALANPDTLVYMMDDTLDQLFSLARSRAHRRWATVQSSGQFAVGKLCSCRLNPLVAYFLAGESALVSTTRLLKPRPRLSEHELLASETEMLCAFRALGHREINAFCEVCLLAAQHSRGAVPAHS